MTPQTSEWQALSERVANLEKQNARLKQIGVVAMVLAASVLLMGQAPATRTVEANEFVLKDNGGTVRGRFSTAGGLGPELVLLHPNGKEGALLHLLCAGSPQYCFPQITLTDQDEKFTVSLSASGGGSDLRLGEVPQLRRVLETTPRGPGRLEEVLKQIRETPGVSLIMDEDGPKLSLLDREGFMTTIGKTDLVTPRTGETSKTSAASVVLFDKDKKVLWTAP